MFMLYTAFIGLYLSADTFIYISKTRVFSNSTVNDYKTNTSVKIKAKKLAIRKMTRIKFIIL